MKKTQAYIDNERLQRAMQHGLHIDASQHSPDRVRRPIAPSTKDQYKQALLIWDGYKRRWPTHEPTDMQQLKHYGDYLYKSTIGRLGEIPTPTSIRIKMRRFYNAWERKYNTEIPSWMKLSMAPFIIKLGQQMSGKKGYRPKKYLTIENYAWMQKFHWTEDFHTYAHEGVRADYTNLLNLHCYTSARQQEICQAVYEDIELMLGWNDGIPEFRFKFIRQICKGTDTDQPEHSFAEVITDEEGHYPPLFAQPMFHMLANMISAGVYPELSTVEEALKLKPPSNIPYRVIALADKCEKRPVFPVWSSSGPQNKKKNPRSWGTQASNWAIRAGLAKGLGLHSVRREALIKANDNGYTLGQVLRFASQHNTSVLVNSYLGNISTIDGAANFLGMKPRTDLSECFRSKTMSRNPGLIQSIPLEEQKNLESSPDYRSTENSIAEIRLLLKELDPKDKKEDLQRQLKEKQDKLRALKRQKLRDLQTSQKIVYESEESLHEQWDQRRSRLNRFKHMLSDERIRLAKIMMEPVSPRSEEWVSALKDLVALRITSSQVAFQEGLRPIDGGCPVPSCKRAMAKISPKDQWKHIYHCYKNMYINESGFAQFCFLCNRWETSEENWEPHCQRHIENHDVPFRCDPFTFRYGIACAGYCPVHLGDTNLAAHKRLQQYISRQDWERHISKCLEQYVTASANDMETFNCPHYRCPVACVSKEDLFKHLYETHSIPTNLKQVEGSNSQDTPKRELNTCETIFKTKTHDDFSLQPMFPAKKSEDYDAMERIDQSSNSSRSEEDVIMLDSGLLVTALDDSKTDIKDIIVDPELYKEIDALSAGVSEMHTDDTNSRELSPPDDDYDAHSLLAKYEYRYKRRIIMLYLVKWNNGTTTWEPEESILKHSLIDELEEGYKGFGNGIEVIGTRIKSKKTQYRVRFLNYAGVKTDEFWWVDEGIIDPEVIKRYNDLIDPPKFICLKGGKAS